MKRLSPATIEAKLEKILSEEFSALEHNTLFYENGQYHAFGIYEIQRTDQGVRVSKYSCPVQCFRDTRTALSWCIADKYQQYVLAQQLVSLDHSKDLLENDIAIRTALLNNIKQSFTREAVFLKIDTRRRKLKHVDNELDKCINLAKYWQIRGFNNETQRTGRTASNRTSR